MFLTSAAKRGQKHTLRPLLVFSGICCKKTITVRELLFAFSIGCYLSTILADRLRHLYYRQNLTTSEGNR